VVKEKLKLKTKSDRYGTFVLKLDRTFFYEYQVELAAAFSSVGKFDSFVDVQSSFFTQFI
jgi:hypothetical protein